MSSGRTHHWGPDRGIFSKVWSEINSRCDRERHLISLFAFPRICRQLRVLSVDSLAAEPCYWILSRFFSYLWDVFSDNSKPGEGAAGTPVAVSPCGVLSECRPSATSWYERLQAATSRRRMLDVYKKYSCLTLSVRLGSNIWLCSTHSSHWTSHSTSSLALFIAYQRRRWRDVTCRYEITCGSEASRQAPTSFACSSKVICFNFYQHVFNAILHGIMQCVEPLPLLTLFSVCPETAASAEQVGVPKGGGVPKCLFYWTRKLSVQHQLKRYWPKSKATFQCGVWIY